MAKQKTAFFCSNCGNEYPKWFGKCSACGEWNTCVEEVVATLKPNTANNQSFKQTIASPQFISQIDSQAQPRIDTQNVEFNRVLGGGIVPGSLVLIGGEPGIGKSTLALQVALNLKDIRTLYISGEESNQQIKLRAERITEKYDNCLVLSETSLENIVIQIQKTNPNIVVIDSIQTLQTERIESTAGSVSQIRECTSVLQRLAKETAIPVILIGHINKEGAIAGPKVLEHIVDTVLQFEGDQNYLYRILRAVKNRFGSTSEIGIFEMLQSGLREVSNPSELLLSQHEEPMSGVAISASMEGMRPFLIEIQALVTGAAYGTPQRSTTGFDLRRLNMLLAVLEKRAGFRLSTKDVFLNIAGGIRVDDPAIDLAVICAVLSSNYDKALPVKTCFAGEVGLTGEIRPVTRVEQRILEAQKLGFTEIVVSKFNKFNSDISRYSIKIRKVTKVEEVFRGLFS